MPKKLTGVVIGPSGIGKAHIRELIRFGFRNICLVGRNFKQDRLNLFKIEYKNTNFFNLKSIKEIKKKTTINIICAHQQNFTTNKFLSLKISVNI